MLLLQVPIEKCHVLQSRNRLTLLLTNYTVHIYILVESNRNFNWISISLVFFFQICIETQPSHPFFVYGKGWASFSPEGTLHEHGLKCQLLEVGDVCISLTPRDHSKATESMTSPQNLSRKQMPSTISTTATGTAVTSRPISSYEPSYSQQMMHQRHPNDSFYGLHGRHHQDRINSDNSLRKYSATMAPPPPPPSETATASYDDEAIDATMHSRKRRTWSISDNICDVPKKNKSN